MNDIERRKRRTALAGGVIIACMLGLTAASVPLYNLFCSVTGYGGTPKRALEEDVPREVRDVVIEVSFNADVAPGLPWAFKPMQRSVDVHPGENTLVFFEAVNHGTQPIVGRAVYNVTPHKTGYYFNKIQCFCFDEQVLQPGERAEMPVSFFVDPEMLGDPDTKDVRQLTLSYTFFADDEATQELARSADDKQSPAKKDTSLQGNGV
ncbi:MAG: cytochrome c oxidase assembly protein [Geminicoccaceae bacterium]|nr:cytochrome c oxidase assembly protein [Geminicoccaceae bacterium]